MYPWIRITNDIAIPTYLLIISLVYTGLLFAVRPRTQKYGLKSTTGFDFALAVMIGGFLGARFFHVAYEHPDFYLANPSEILKFWQGGYVFYGGFLGALFAVLVVSRIQYINDLNPWLDAFAPLLAAGYGLGRIGCFLAGCCYGEVCDLPWAVTFPPGGDAPSYGSRHPTQLYATVWELLTVVLLLWIEKKQWNKKIPGGLFFLWLTTHSAGRIVMESFRDDFRGPMVSGLSVSTILSGIFLVVGFLWLASHIGKSRTSSR